MIYILARVNCAKHDMLSWLRSWEWRRQKYIHLCSLCSRETLFSWQYSFPQRIFQIQASLSGAASQCLGKHKLVWHCCHIYHLSSTSHCLELQRVMENMIFIYPPLLEATDDYFMKLLIHTEQKCRGKLSLSKTAETLLVSQQRFSDMEWAIQPYRNVCWGLK